MPPFPAHSVLSVKVSVPVLAMPSPELAVSPDKALLLLTVSDPALEMQPPVRAELLDRLLQLKVAVPLLSMPPP